MSGYTARAWRAIATGGRWTFTEVRAACPGDKPKMLDNAIRAMTSAGMLVRYEGDPPRYGITADCNIPRGMSIAEVMKVMGVES